MSQKYRELGLVKSEYEQIREALGRDPTFTELSMYAVMWSEHCSYKSSRPVLKDLPSSGKGVLQGPGENAGLVDIGGGLAVALKIESHNHPSAIEPYQGAATGVGGIIRDIFTMGARPVAILDSLRFGRLSDAKVRYLFDQVVAGIAGYGNCIGVPTVGGEIYFADSYEKNPLVNAMAVGVVEKDRVIKGIAPIDGDSAILFGSKTGRDGIHGVTFASEELSDRSVKKRPAVQIADPFTEKLLIEACLELNEMNLLRGLQDLGGGGLTCASSEMAAKGDSGMELDVSMVDRREEGMDPFEVMLSESQERMLAVVAPEDEARVLGVCRKWGLEAAVVGKVTKTGSLTIKSDGSIVAEVPAKSLTDGPVLERTAKEPAYLKQVPEVDAGALDIPHDLSETVLSLLRSENLGRKNMVYEQYDYDVGTKTVAGPGQGAALLKIGEAGLAMTVDGNGRYCFLDPFEGARIAVAEAARNLACVGARPVALTNCLNYGSPENPEVFWQFKEGVRGMSEAAVAFGVPIVSGNVSFYNEVEGSPIYPTPVVGMVGTVRRVKKPPGVAFKRESSLVALIGETAGGLGGSEFLSTVHGRVGGGCPVLDLEVEKRIQDLIIAGIEAGLFESVQDISDGGLVTALAESVVGGRVGAVIDLSAAAQKVSVEEVLFGESQSRVLVSLSEAATGPAGRLAGEKGVSFTIIGKVSGQNLVVDDRIHLGVQKLETAWSEGLEAPSSSGGLLE